MARTPKYTAKIITREVVYIDNATCQPASNLTETARLIDGINGGEKYTFCELYSCQGAVTGNTLNALEHAAWEWANDNNNFDIHLHIVK